MKERLTKLLNTMEAEYNGLDISVPERVALLCSMADLGCELARIEAAREMHIVLEQEDDEPLPGLWVWNPGGTD